MPRDVPEYYAESMMVHSLSQDGSVDLSIRLARFPSKNNAHVWIHLATPEGAWSIADESFELDTREATPVENESVIFSAHGKERALTFESTSRHSEAMSGNISGSILLKNSRHPNVGTGTIAASFDIHFAADSEGFKSNKGRWELTGEVTGSVLMGNRTWKISDPGKWHEQTGIRKKFAPAFTYFNVQNNDVSLLAIGFSKKTTGYVMVDGLKHNIEQFTIDKQGSIDRNFVISLDNGNEIKGVAREIQQWSVPIEGARRPGSSVIVDSNLGRMMGSLNDWQPSKS